MRSVKTYAMMMHVDNELKKVVQLKPKYEVSPELEKNIKSYACGVLLSTKLISYKGDAPLQALLVCLTLWLTHALTLIEYTVTGHRQEAVSSAVASRA